MAKFITDFIVAANLHPSEGFSLLTLTPADGKQLPMMAPGQFVQVKVDDSPSTFLRRPISICDVDYGSNTLKLLVRAAGDGTRHLINLKEGDTLNLIYPLGNGFDIPSPDNLPEDYKPLLIGGGVGTAPMMMLAKRLACLGVKVTTLIGARSEGLLLLRDELSEVSDLLVTTDDGSFGVKGVVTDHPLFSAESRFTHIYCCGPAPMMKGVARKAKELNIECEVSLENMMACGMGACLCCVEKTVAGNTCVCTAGPVFNIKELTW